MIAGVVWPPRERKWEMRILQAECATDSIQNHEREFSMTMTKELESLRAEIKAINLWDRLYLESPHTEIESVAFVIRQIRRQEIVQQLADMSSRN